MNKGALNGFRDSNPDDIVKSDVGLLMGLYMRIMA